MNVNSDRFFVNRCEYTPVYLIQNTSVTQCKSFEIKQEPKPVGDNLKRFYENSGNLESSLLLSSSEQIQKQSPSNKETSHIGNNLKLASFLLPKTEAVYSQRTNIQPVVQQNTLPKTVNDVVNQQLAAASNFVLKPTALKGSTNIVYKINKPIISHNRKDFPKQKQKVPQNPVQARILPKISPKENVTPQLASVQLLKLGGTYHSLNNLNNNQIKIVNHALKNIDDVEKIPKEPTYDPITNTRIVYKVVSPRDLKVVGKNKVVFKEKKLKKEPKSSDDEEEVPKVTKKTRSGRVVKSPKFKQLPVETQSKYKKRSNVISCFQCSSEFNGLYNLQKHYDSNPTHIPSKIHTNLFHCLLAILNGTTKEDRANIFVQQLELLVAKLKSLLPCLLKKLDGIDGTTCTINNDLAKIFDMEPGSYDLNIEALSCIKNKEGQCVHNQSPRTQFSADLSKPSQLWLSKHIEDLANSEQEVEHCARNTAVDKWPTVKKRLWRLKKLKSQMVDSKKMKLEPEKREFLIKLQPEEFVILDNPETPVKTTVTPPSLEIGNAFSANENHANIIQANINNTSCNTDSNNITNHVNSPIYANTQIDMSYKNNIVPEIKLLNNSENISHVPDLNEIHNNIDEIQNANLHSPFESTFDSEIQNNANIFLNNKIEAPITSFTNEQYENVIINTISKINGKCKDIDVLQGAQFETDDLNPTSIIDDIHNSVLRVNEFDTDMINAEDSQDEKGKPKINHMNFHSAHFDIRSSPIKPSSTVFRKFQIKPQEISKFEVQIIRPLQLDLNVENENARDGVTEPDASILLDLQTIKNDIELQCKDALLNRELSFEKTWVQTADDNSHESYMKPNNLIKPSMLHVKDDSVDNSVTKDLNHVVNSLSNSDSLPTSQGQSVLQFFDLGNDCLSYPEADIRNNTEDFNLDLFSFNNS